MKEKGPRSNLISSIPFPWPDASAHPNFSFSKGVVGKQDIWRCLYLGAARQGYESELLRSLSCPVVFLIESRIVSGPGRCGVVNYCITFQGKVLQLGPVLRRNNWTLKVQPIRDQTVFLPQFGDCISRCKGER